MASPSAACRPWPTCSGPVGLAETNSIITLAPRPRSERPYAAPRSRIVRAMRCLAAGLRRKLMKPGPAISGFSIHAEAGSAATSCSATLRGGVFRVFASCSATVVA